MSELSLVDFLLARLDEDEALATDALTRDHWAYEGYGDYGPFVSGAGVETEDSLQGQQIARYLVAMNPWRVLVEVQAKRRIVDAVDILTGGEKPYLERLKHSDIEDAHYVIARRILALLALPFADHPDYRAEEWTP